MKSTSVSETDLKEQAVTEVEHDLEMLGLSTLFRCDGCGVQAFAAATKGDLIIFLCRKQFLVHSPALQEQGWAIEDRTHLLNEKPSVSANV